jgi:hypothetical protein
MATMKIEYAAPARRAIGEMGLNPLLLVVLVLFRLFAGRPVPVVFNLSIAQVLRLLIHNTHISLKRT